MPGRLQRARRATCLSRMEKVRQLCSRVVQRFNLLGVRFASSLAAAAPGTRSVSARRG
ncbi:MAG: hypothetical protein K0S45_2811 [Nitrospira sp.]|nr:hypothetical protein [Nitrospira sp.]